MTNFSRITLGAASLAVLGACEAPREAVSRAAPADAMRVLGYKGIETRLLDGDLVQFVVTMDGWVQFIISAKIGYRSMPFSVR